MAGLSRAFITALLKALGAPATPANVTFLTAWAHREGGRATYNPWNTTYAMPGATNMNSVGVKNYVSMAQGVQATAATLRAAWYSDIVGALRAGNASTTARYTGLHIWSAGPNGPADHGYWSLSGMSGGPLPATSTGPSSTTPPPPKPPKPVAAQIAAPSQATGVMSTVAARGIMPSDALPHEGPSSEAPGHDPLAMDLLWSNMTAAGGATPTYGMGQPIDLPPEVMDALYANMTGGG